MRCACMKRENLELIQQWAKAQKPDPAYIRSIRLRRLSTQNRALSQRITSAPKPR
jgi:hypothetical protein